MRNLLRELAIVGCLVAPCFSLLLSCGGENNASSGQEEKESLVMTDSAFVEVPNRAFEMYKLIPETELPQRCVNLEFPEAPQADGCLFETWYEGDDKDREAGFYGIFSLACFHEGDVTYVCYSARGGCDGAYQSEGNGVFSYKDGEMQRLKVAFPQPDVMAFFEDEVNLLGLDAETMTDIKKNYASHFDYKFVPAGDECTGGVLVGLDLSYLRQDDGNQGIVTTPSFFYEFKNGSFIRKAEAYMDLPAYVLEASGIGGMDGYVLGGQRHLDKGALPSYAVEIKGDVYSYSKDGEKYFSAKVENDYVTGISVFTRKFALYEEYGDGCGIYAVGKNLGEALENGFTGGKGLDGKLHAEKNYYDEYIVDFIADDKDSVISEIRMRLSPQMLKELLPR